MGKKKKKKKIETFDLNKFVNAIEKNAVPQTVAQSQHDNVPIWGMNVNLKRHIKEIKDSLKPVERRILACMHEKRLYPQHGKERKCSRVIGDVMKYHPHGESGPSNSLMLMSQEWRNNIELVNVYGGNGSAADPQSYPALRYPTCSLSEFAYDCYFSEWTSLNYEADKSIDYANNFDDTCLEPLYLPAKYPVFLLNWHTAMGFGLDTASVGFNPSDAFKLIIQLIKDPEAKVEIYPDDPLGCTIMNKYELKTFLDKKSSSIKIRAEYEVEEVGGQTFVTISQAPFQVKPVKIEEKIKENRARFPEIEDIELIPINKGKEFEINIAIRRGYDPHGLMYKIYKYTQLQTTFTTRYNFVDELENEEYTPRIATLEWIRYRQQTIRRINKMKLINIGLKAHVLFAKVHIIDNDLDDKLFKIIKKNKRADAVLKIMEKFDFTDHQADHIAKMRADEFTIDMSAKAKKELKELDKEYKRIRKLIDSDESINNIIIEQMEEGIEKYGYERKSKVANIFEKENIIDTNHFIIITDSYIKKLPHRTDGYKIGSICNGEKVRALLTVNNHDTIHIFMHNGKVLPINVHKIPDTTIQSQGISLSNIGLKGEFVCARKFDDTDKGCIGTVTKNGLFTKIPITELNSRKVNSVCAWMKMNKGDELADAVYIGDDSDTIMVYTKSGNAVTFAGGDFDANGRQSKGYYAIKDMEENEDTVVAMTTYTSEDDKLIVITDRGYMKQFKIKTMPKDNKKFGRNTKGFQISDGKNVVKVMGVSNSKESIIAYSNQGAFIVDINEITSTSRIGKMKRVIELPSTVYLFDVIK